MKYLIFRLLVVCLFLDSCASSGETLIVAVAANLSAPMHAVASAYQETHGKEVDLVMASSGVLTAQIRNGAPYKIFLSADESYPQVLFDTGICQEAPRVLVYGNLVLWLSNRMERKTDSSYQEIPTVKSFAIANPDLAPYGIAAQHWMQTKDLWEVMQPSLIFGENVGQVNQYIRSGTVDAALTAISAMYAQELQGKGRWKPIQQGVSTSIPHAGVLIDNADPEAVAFWQFLFTDQVRQIFTEFGYQLPPPN